MDKSTTELLIVFAERIRPSEVNESDDEVIFFFSDSFRNDPTMMQKKRDVPAGVWYCIMFAGFCPIIISIGSILLLSATLTTTEFNGDFVGHRSVACTIVASKVIDNGGLWPHYVGVAAAQIASIPFDVAVIRQTDRSRRATIEIARTILDVTIGSNYTCGLPPTGEPANYALASMWPVAGVGVVGFDREFAQAQLTMLESMWISGIVFLSVGLGVLLLVVALYFIARDCTCDCDCGGCCSDYYEQYMLERRINSSGAFQNNKGSNADFTDDGLLKHYTCKYGAGACCTLFLSRLCGRRAAPLPPEEVPNAAPQMEEIDLEQSE